MTQRAFIELIKPFQDKLYRLAKRLLISEDEAQDATQEIYLKLWQKRRELPTYNSVEALAVTMTKNYCLDRLKSKQAGNLSIVHQNFKDESGDTAKRVEIQDQISLVHQLIDKLPETQRIIIQLRDVEQFELKEIEQILDMKPTAVRVNLSRARKTIKENLIKQLSHGIR
ncbi:MAG: RNA polymerase subunit sigma-70 [Flavobacteriia bacterium]|nr:MAG: RNA polymerase subunit sigma-70 [Flavobacteriia bacterium]